MRIKPEDKTIKQILNCGATYIVPRFQREYSWDQNNYKEFLEDMLKALVVENGTIKANDYFMGTMLFVEQSAKSKMINVIDGQQRLTTITILFSVLSDRFKELKEETLSQQIFKYIMTQDDDGEDVRVIKSNTSYPYFSFYIQDREKTKKVDANSEEEVCILKTYEYLYEKTAESNLRKVLSSNIIQSEECNFSYIDILKALRDQVLQTNVVSISTQEKDQANKIFEILNAKGKRLADVDLIKNKIFEILYKTEPADFAETRWSSIKRALYNSKTNVGFATFYRHFWISNYKKTSMNKLYDHFNTYLKPKTEETYERFLIEMEKNVNWYIQIVDPSREYWGNRKEYFLCVQSLNIISNYFNIAQTRIALLGLFELKEKKLISLSDFEQTIQKMEQFHFLYNAICSKRSNSLEKIYTDFSLGSRKCLSKDDVNECIREMMNNFRALLPSYDEFETKFINLTFTKKYSLDNVKAKYAVYYRYNLSEGKNYGLFPEDGTIEHIVPESNSVNALNIGNLIVLEKKINDECKNMEYKIKKEKYSMSKYQGVRNFVKKYETWTEKDINNRAKEMAHDIYNAVKNFI